MRLSCPPTAKGAAASLLGHRQIMPVEDGWLGLERRAALVIAEQLLGLPDEACCCKSWHSSCTCTTCGYRSKIRAMSWSGRM